MAKNRQPCLAGSNACGESQVDAPKLIEEIKLQPLRILSINIRCLLSKLTELVYICNLFDVDIVLVQETWLDASVEKVILPGYILLSRLDRSENENRGGVCAFCRDSIKNVVLWKTSPSAERVWHIAHRDTGAVAICNWYRPPGAPDETITSLDEELKDIAGHVHSVILCVDLNIHHSIWLKYSSSNTAAGRYLQEVCQNHGLKQLVQGPTRGEYLLDLILSDLEKLKVSIH